MQPRAQPAAALALIDKLDRIAARNTPLEQELRCPGRFAASALCLQSFCCAIRPGLRLRQPTRLSPSSAGRLRSRARRGSEERIRYFDVQHVKAELTLATRQKEVRGTVTHTLSPLHPYLTKVELDCAPELKVTKVTKRARAEGRSLHVHHVRRQAHRHARQSPRPRRHPRPGDRLLGLAHRGASVRPQPIRPIPRSRWRSGRRARPRTRITGFPATTTPTTARRPK